MKSVDERIGALRQEMKREGLAAYIVPSADPHQSEYVADHYKSRAFISGFTGSQGTVVVTRDACCLWTDGRYFIQAEREIADNETKLYKMYIPGVPKVNEYLKEHIQDGEKIGYDSRLFSIQDIRELQAMWEDHSVQLVGDHDLMARIWHDRPGIPDAKVFYHDVVYTGLTTQEKIEAIRKDMSSKKASVYLISSLNDIAWLFNIRGGDVAYTPVAYAYAMITLEEAVLYIQEEKVSTEVQEILKKQGVALRPYEAIFDEVEETTKGKTVVYDPTKLNSALGHKIDKSTRRVEAKELIMVMKARMNPVEQENLRNCQIRDGVAMVKFLKWLDETVPHGQVTEVTAANHLIKLRSEQALYIEDSFNTISAYRGNAAMMHYAADEKTAAVLEPNGLYLVDSGGQYLDGTTDITRTIVLGEITGEERRDFTLVLKSHIALNRLVFLYGVIGTNLDAIARQPIWQAHMDYKCGTGHSVGYLLGVHEGPAKIRMDVIDYVIEEGMYLTNEPGIYKENKHGIRTENDILVKEVACNEHGRFLGFEVISFCPIDLRGIESSMLTVEEREWLNNYHQEVYDKLSPHLNEEERQWLQHTTRSI